MPVDPSQIDRAIATIEARYGRENVHYGSTTPIVKRIPTGSLELDFITSGGIPIGRMSRFYGGQSSGKSLICWNVIREAQALGMTCAYYNVEKQYTADFTASRGVDIDRLHVIEGTTIEEIGTKVEALLGAVHLHIVDSCSAAVSIDELNSNVEDWHRGLNARVWGKVFRRVNERFDSNENTLIFVDQVREKLTYAGGEHPPGGRAMEHASSMSLHFHRGSWLFKNKKGVLQDKQEGTNGTLSGGLEADGIEIKVKCVKSRVGRPLRVAQLNLDLNTMGFDHLHELAKAARYFKLVDSAGAWFQLPNGSKLHGIAQLRDHIQEDDDFRGLIRETVLEAA